MSKKFNKKVLTVIVALIAIIAVVGSSLAWFVTRTSKTQRFSVFGINVTETVSFSDGKRSIGAEKYKDEDGLYTLSLDKNDENYIGNLRIYLEKSGIKCCLRVKMVYEWSNADGSVKQHDVMVPYVFDSEWYDNRNTDYCVYYQGADKSGKAASTAFYLINGFDESSFDTTVFEDGTTVKVLIEIDAVQFNRYPQMWNIEKLPWEK